MKRNKFYAESDDQTSKRLDNILDILGGEENIKTFSVSQNKIVVEVSNLKEININNLHDQGPKRIDMHPAIIAFDLDEKLLNYMLKLLINNGDFEFNYSNVKPDSSLRLTNNTKQEDDIEFVNKNFLMEEYRVKKPEKKQSPLINKIDTKQQELSLDHTIISIDDYIDYNHDLRPQQWAAWAGHNEQKQICCLCSESDNWTTILFNNNNHICHSCWLKKPTYETIMMINKKKYIRTKPIIKSFVKSVVKNKPILDKQELDDSDEIPIVKYKRADKKWISKVEHEDSDEE